MNFLKSILIPLVLLLTITTLSAQKINTYRANSVTIIFISEKGVIKKGAYHLLNDVDPEKSWLVESNLVNEKYGSRTDYWTYTVKAPHYQAIVLIKKKDGGIYWKNFSGSSMKGIEESIERWKTYSEYNYVESYEVEEIFNVVKE